MTYRSESRGFMYTAPPSGDDDRTDGTPEATAEESATEDEASDLESTNAATDANWTGTVSADD